MFKNQRSVAMDAASSSGMAFLSSQLELMDPKLVEPLAAVTHPRDMIIKSGGGYPEFTSAYAADFATTGGNQFGLQGTEATDQAVVQTSINKGVWPTNIFSAAQLIPYVDLQRLMEASRSGIPAPFSLQSLLDQGVKLIWGKAMDRVTYLGWNGQPGLINNTNIAYQIAPSGASGHPQWTTKTTTEILNDFNTVLLATQSGSGYDTAGLADTVLVDFTHWNILNQPMTLGGFNSLLEYILANNMARRQGIELEILPLPNPWISTQGYGGSSRLVAYKKTEETLYLKVPQPIQRVMTVPDIKNAGYSTLFMGCIGVVQVLRNTACAYLDEI